VKDFNVPAKIRNELKARIEQIEKLINEGHKLSALLKLPASSDNDNIVRATPAVRPRTTSAAPAVVFGRDEDLQIIRQMLHDDSNPSTTNCYSVIGIHGIPGSGKTTLAQYVFESERKESHFDLFMWIHASQNFDVNTILFEMLEIASGRKMDMLSNPDMLRRGLEEQLSGKRFFLVLDDVWKGASEQKLDSLLSPLKAGREGSKILVTTRFADAAKDLRAQNLVPIGGMEKEQYVSMFMHYALDGATTSDQAALMVEKECIGRKIAEKLGGSPLAARAVAGQLRRRSNIDFWRRTLTRDSLSDNTVGALWWSYQQLEEPVRQCFTYCSMFPRRYQLDRDELVHLWMAQGFVETTATNATEDIEDVGNEYFEELLSCSFIQSVGNIAQGSGSFKIHDLLYDLARKVAGSDSFKIDKDHVDEIPRDVRHLFIESYDKKVHTDQILKLETLRTLFMSSRSGGMAAQDLEGLLKGLTKLRVLHVNFSNDRKEILLPVCIGEMKHLRYLFINGNLRNKVILPPAFGKLYHLQKFGALCYCCLGRSSDKEMGNLINLRYMQTMNTLKFPNVGRLKLLRTLNTFTVEEDAGYEIQQLENLNNIRGNLIIYGLEAVKRKEEARQANLANKIHISYLELEWCYNCESSNLPAENQTEGRTRDPPEEILEALRPPLLVTSLSIRNYRGSTYPSWLSGKQGALENLQHLYFSNCNGSDAPPNLRGLSVRVRTLSISDCSWKSLPDNMEHLRSLEELNIMDCKNIMSLPRLPVSLQRLSLIGWNGSDRPPRVGEALVQLHRLHICSCSWSSLPENMDLLTSLEELAIDDCENILLIPELPRSLKKFQVMGCSHDLTESCRTHGHPNWVHIAHVPEEFKSIC
jgi:Leucine-rich repeat (LRR) protein